MLLRKEKCSVCSGKQCCIAAPADPGSELEGKGRVPAENWGKHLMHHSDLPSSILMSAQDVSRACFCCVFFKPVAKPA